MERGYSPEHTKGNYFVSELPHKCGDCGRQIPPGMRYILKWRIVIGADKKAHRQVYRAHPNCEEIPPTQ